MAYIDDYIKEIEQTEVKAIVDQLMMLEQGEMRTGECRPGGNWTDTTDREIRRLQKILAEYEALLVEYRSGRLS